MHATRPPTARGSRARSIGLILTIASSLAVVFPAGALAQDEAAETDPAAAACESAADLRMIIGFLQDTSVSEDGIIPVVVGGIAGISVAQDLAGEVRDTLGPLVEEVIVSMQGLRDIGDEMSGDETLGAKVATIGESIVEIGESMDALSLQLQERCPTDE